MRGSAPRLAASALLLVLPLGLGSCAGLRFQHVRAGVEPDLRAARALQPGTSTLEDCLVALGAPLTVDENENGGGRVLTWSWEHVHGWGLFFSLPLSEWVSASLNYDEIGRDPERLRLLFDERWVLRERVED
jgi:hypothetical protein